MNRSTQDRDELRARFTGWMEVTLYRARRRYLQKRERELSLASLNDVPESVLQASQEDTLRERFEFQEEALAEAFYQLSTQKQTILTLLYAEEWKPSEVAHYLNCSPRQIYDQRYQAIKFLRKYIQTRGEHK